MNVHFKTSVDIDQYRSANKIVVVHIVSAYKPTTKMKYIYILLNGLTYHPAEYFTSFERIFPSPERGKGEEKCEKRVKCSAGLYVKPFNGIFII